MAPTNENPTPPRAPAPPAGDRRARAPARPSVNGGVFARWRQSRTAAVLEPLRAWALDDSCGSVRTRRWLDALVFTAFVALVLVGAAHHEVWRDEARALTLALEPSSWLGLRATLEDEGHPGLWHLLLRAAHTLAPTPLVLPVLTAVVGVAAAALVYFAAPLPTWWRTGFLFGLVPLFQGAILCRNYGIAMLLVHAFCALVGRGRLPALTAALALALLANTNAYGAMMAVALGGFLLVEAWRRGVGRGRVALAGALVTGGVLLAAWTVTPTAASKLRPVAPRSVEEIADTVVAAVAHFGEITGLAFGIAAAAWPIVLLTALAAWPAKHLTLAVLAFFGAAACFVVRVYSAAPHHLGMLFTFLVAATWLCAAGGAARVRHRLPRAAWLLLLVGVWPLLLAVHGYRGLRAVKLEVESTTTAAPELAQLLERPGLEGAVLVGEPDYFLDALPWYRDNALFVAREDRFARRVSWTTANRRESDLGALLATARRLQREGHAPVVLVVGAPIDLGRPAGDVVHGYGDRFRWNAEQQRAFVAATEHLASLPARPSRFRGDERYEVYRLR